MHGRILLLTLLVATVFFAGCAPQKSEHVVKTVDASLRDTARVTLVKMLANENPSIRANAIEGVQDTLGTDGRLYFFDALKDESPIVRFAALMAIGKTRAYNGREFVTPLMSDRDASVQLAAVYANFRLGGSSQNLRALELALTNQNPAVRGNACLILGILGEPSAVRVLRPKLKDSTAEVALQAAEALWKLGNEDGRDALLAYSMRGDPGIQIFSIHALAEPKNARIIQHVRVGLSSEYFEVKLHSALALGMLGSDEGKSIALQAVVDPEVRNRVDGAIALGEIGKPAFATALAPLLNDTDDKVKTAASIAILKLKANAKASDASDDSVDDESDDDGE